MPPIVASTEVDRPAAEVFAYATDPTRFAEWQKGVVEGRLDDGGPPTVGSRCVITRRIAGADRPATSEITHLDPPRTWVLVTLVVRREARTEMPANLAALKHRLEAG